MMNKKCIPSLFVFAVCIAAALAWCVSGEGYGKEKDEEKKNGAVESEYHDSSSCFGCHNKGTDNAFSISICSLDEFKVWETQDKHRLAYLALKGKRAEIMSKNLGYDVKNAKACLACHSTWIEDKKQRNDNAVLIEEGVGCFVCHTKEKVDWVDLHGGAIKKKREKWRLADRGEKEKLYGMRDLWDPAKRTQLCVSCHIGNAEHGKILTHEMYAAGHPPLPSFDMSTFSDAMRHWQYLSEKSEEVKREFKFSKSEVEREQINLVNVGSLVSFRETMLLLGKQTGMKDSWPELAQFDCYSCHHDLKLPSWRQERGYAGGKPGRPQVPAWSTALVELALYHSSGNDPEAAAKNIKDFRTELDKLRAAFDAQPFGDAKAIGTATESIIRFIDPKIKILETLPVKDKSVHRGLLTQLIEKQNGTLLDHESARQVAGAFRAIYADGWKGAKQDEVLTQLLALDNELTLRFKSEARNKFDEVRLAITKDLVKHRTEDLKRKSNQLMLGKFLDSNREALQENYSQEMNAYLEKVNNYDPKQFRQKMNKIGDSLNKESPKGSGSK